MAGPGHASEDPLKDLQRHEEDHTFKWLRVEKSRPSVDLPCTMAEQRIWNNTSGKARTCDLQGWHTVKTIPVVVVVCFWALRVPARTHVE